MLRRRGLLRSEANDDHDTREPEPIEACAQLSLRLGKLGHVDARGIAHEPASERRSRGCMQAATRSLPWADLLKRVYDIDSLACSRCSDRLRMIAPIVEKQVVRRILASLGLPCEPPVIARARAPTLLGDPPPPDYDAA